MARESADEVAAAWAGEESLLSSEVRDDASAIDELLDPSFREFGASGRVWSRDAVIAAVVGERPSTEGVDGWAISQRQQITLGEGLVHLSYRLERDGRVSQRSSVWRVENGRARILFHQGTTAGAT
jgi:hypothetical protein